jgi:hypothetical protein
VSKRASQKSAQNRECSKSTRESTDCKTESKSAAPQDGLGGNSVAVMQAAYPQPGDHLAALPRRRRWNSASRRVVGQSDMCPISVVQVDNATPIVLNREKSVILGIPGTTAW